MRAVRHGDMPGRVVVEGVRLVAEAVDRGAPLDLLLCSPRAEERPGLAEAADRMLGHPVCQRISDRELSELASGPSHQGVIAVVRLPEFRPEDCTKLPSVLVCLDGVQDPANFGGIVRAARAFGASGVWYRSGGARPDNQRAYRASAGALLDVPVAPLEDLEAALQSLRWPVYVADARGEDIDDLWPQELPIALVMGGEGAGAKVRVGRMVSIAMEAGSESLNVAQAATILLSRVHVRMRR